MHGICLITEMLFIIDSVEKCLYGGKARKARKADYHTSLHHQLAFYIMMFKKKKSLYLKCVFYFAISCGVGMGEREGWEGKFICHRRWWES